MQKMRQQFIQYNHQNKTAKQVLTHKLYQQNNKLIKPNFLYFYYGNK